MLRGIVEKLDKKFTNGVRRMSIPLIRLSFGIIYIWFGILKPLGLSAAEELLKSTVTWLPFGAPEDWLIIIGWWEVSIGVFFLFNRTTKIAIILVLIQVMGTFMPLVFLPEVAFQSYNFLVPTLEGQYIIKNVMIVAAAFVLAGHCGRAEAEEQ